MYKSINVVGFRMGAATVRLADICEVLADVLHVCINVPAALVNRFSAKFLGHLGSPMGRIEDYRTECLLNLRTETMNSYREPLKLLHVLFDRSNMTRDLAYFYSPISRFTIPTLAKA